jgi:hypothetical protein
MAQDAGIKHVSASGFRHRYRAWLDEPGTPSRAQPAALRNGEIRVTTSGYGDLVNNAFRDASSTVAEAGYQPVTDKSAN